MFFKQDKDGKNCDGICSTCTFCLYDRTINLNGLRKKTCNSCENFKKLTLKNGKTAFVCNKYSSLIQPKKKKVIVYDKPEGEEIDTPLWCPLVKKDKLTYAEREKLWKGIKPINDFENIKEKTWYHIPPINGRKRKDIFVVNKLTYTLEYREKGYTYISIMRNDDLAINFMSEIEQKAE